MPTPEDRSRPRTDGEALAAVLTRARSLRRRRVGIASSAIVVLLVLATTAISGGVGQRQSSDQRVVAGLGQDAATTTTTLAGDQEVPTTVVPAPPLSSTTVPPSTTTTSAPRPGSPPGWFPSNGGPARAPLRVTLHLEARSVRGGDELRGEVVVENTSASDYRYETGGCGGDWGFYRDGEWQGPPIVCTMEIRHETLAAGEVRRRPFSIAAERGDGFDSRTPLPPGTYDFFASFHANGYEHYAAPIAVEVT